VPVIALSMLAGPLVDRVETRRLLTIALLGQAVVAVPLAFVTAPLATVLLFAALASLGALVRPAGAALVPAITGSDGAARGYARVAAAFGIGGIVGPAIGGLLTAAGGPAAAVLGDAASFAALAGITLLIRTRRPPAAAGGPAHADGPRGGFRIALGHPVLRATQLIAVLGIAFAVIDNVASPYRIADDLAGGGGGFGLAMTLWSAGALAGTQLVPRLPERLHPVVLAASAVVMGAAIAGIGLAPSLGVAFAASVVGGIGNGGLNVAQTAVLARFTPERAHGRAFAAAGAMIQSAIGVGTLVAAPLTTALGAGGAMTVAGLATVVAASAGALTLRRPSVTARPADS
ncbi:MAG: MFS transporter, partial [Amnibacterium sp.]